ncbi:nucleoside 2-deoxyribosyltransferase [Prochlorococcus marinus]|uniref:Nucleoside 2-deoxyribosyltransferase n=1 Tax=Prochlorococcus marinus XMU1408 TaxID=2213228 RepID=A0A318R1D2_PROMR|nr:nucleoside 2-deoxyribosyltransferase [Prochlorococcus marinus]MBW3041719.1 nucleoside 2-deoxyribosyltransferase [Prochlorococcus marinus str. XMU1408]PYE03277.1 nucleoside 2-deoxyribosyltransferase [Prochlorococcus marinus XMU1408]
MVNKKLYLASPYGFSDHWRSKLLPEFITKLESMGVKVLEPFDRNSDIDLSVPGWANKVARSNLRDLRSSDGLFAIVNGSPPDDGVMVELGVAIALGKPTFLFRDDFRKCTDSDEYPLNLMIFLGIPYESWKDYYYSSIDEIESKNKAIYKWLRN